MIVRRLGPSQSNLAPPDEPVTFRIEDEELRTRAYVRGATPNAEDQPILSLPEKRLRVAAVADSRNVRAPMHEIDELQLYLAAERHHPPVRREQPLGRVIAERDRLRGCRVGPLEHVHVSWIAVGADDDSKRMRISGRAAARGDQHQCQQCDPFHARRPFRRLPRRHHRRIHIV